MIMSVAVGPVGDFGNSSLVVDVWCIEAATPAWISLPKRARKVTFTMVAIEILCFVLSVSLLGERLMRLSIVVGAAVAIGVKCSTFVPSMALGVMDCSLLGEACSRLC